MKYDYARVGDALHGDSRGCGVGETTTTVTNHDYASVDDYVSSSSAASTRGRRLPKVCRVSWGNSRARFLICRSCCSVGRMCEMEGRREDVETSPSSPFSSVVSPPREVGGLSQMWPLPDICYGARVDGPQPYRPRN